MKRLVIANLIGMMFILSFGGLRAQEMEDPIQILEQIKQQERMELENYLQEHGLELPSMEMDYSNPDNLNELIKLMDSTQEPTSFEADTAEDSLYAEPAKKLKPPKQPPKKNNDPKATEDLSVDSKSTSLMSTQSMSVATTTGQTSSLAPLSVEQTDMPSRGGNFNYSVPLPIPPGINGVAPNLSLEYDSNSRNGMLGWGWSIAGLPSISRQNYGIGIWYSSADTFFGPDGRLVKNDDGCYYPESVGGTTCYTPSDEAGNPNSWEVKLPNGAKMFFGGNDDAKITRPGTSLIRSWALTKYQDKYLNEYTVTYTKDSTNGDFYPNSIYYTKHNGSNPSVLREIYFYFENRPDTIYSNAQNAKMIMDKRLKSITIKAGGTVLRTYNFNYRSGESDGAHVSLLASIQQVGSGGTSLNPITFQYSEGAQNFPYFLPHNGEAYKPTTLNSSFHSSNTRVYTADFNGDGASDILEITGEHSWTADYVHISERNGNFKKYKLSLPFGFSSLKPVHILDANGDGCQDLLIIADGHKALLTSNCNGTFFVRDHGTATHQEPLAGAKTNYSDGFVLTGDFNGDQIDDVYIVNEQGRHHVYFGNKEASFTKTNVASVNSDLYFMDCAIMLCVSSNLEYKVGDFNGDGRSDLFAREKSTGKQAVIYSRGFGIFSNHVSTMAEAQADEKLWGAHLNSNVDLYIGDYNGDGRSDIFIRDRNTVTKSIFFSKGYDGKFTRMKFTHNTYASPMFGFGLHEDEHLRLFCPSRKWTSPRFTK